MFNRLFWNHHSDSPLILYKYLPQTIFSLRVLIQEAFWFSHYESLNDPAEFKCLLDKALEKDRRTLRSKDTEQEWTYNHAIDWLERSVVFSASETPTNPVMWAHYASLHKGFAIGFVAGNLRTSVSKKYRHWLKVNYLNSPPVLTKSDIDEYEAANVSVEDKRFAQYVPIEIRHDYHPILIKKFASKSEDWAYEREYRLTDRATDGAHGKAVKFLPGTVRQIIFGKDCDLGFQNDIRLVTKGWGVKYFQVQQSESNYEFDMKALGNHRPS